MISFIWDKVIFYGKLLPESSWKSSGWVYLQAWLLVDSHNYDRSQYIG